MAKKIIVTKNAPEPIGPYNQAVLAGGTLYISGQICIDPVSGNLKHKDLQEETHQVMQNLKAILQEAGMNFSNVLKTTIFLTDMHRFGEVNEIYGKYFPSNPPARATFAVKGLPLGAKVEIEATALQ